MAVEPILGPASTLQANAQACVLYERHARSIYAHCLSRLRNREDAEDALQATYLNALRSFRRGVVPELELAWLFAISNRVISNRRRADARRRRIETPHDLQELQDVLAAPVAGAVDLVRLRESLAAMPEQQRRAFLLREWQGLSCREIAAELDVSTGAVEQLLFRARRTLQQELTKPQSRLRRLRGFGLGSLLIRLKSLLGLGTAAKLAAVATTAVVASMGAVANSRPVQTVSVAPAHVEPARGVFTRPTTVPARTAALNAAHAVFEPLVWRPTAVLGVAVGRTAARPAAEPDAPVVESGAAPAAAPQVQGADEDPLPTVAADPVPIGAEDDSIVRTMQPAGPAQDPGPSADLPEQAAAAIETHAAGTPAATGELPSVAAAAQAASADTASAVHAALALAPPPEAASARAEAPAALPPVAPLAVAAPDPGPAAASAAVATPDPPAAAAAAPAAADPPAAAPAAADPPAAAPVAADPPAAAPAVDPAPAPAPAPAEPPAAAAAAPPAAERAPAAEPPPDAPAGDPVSTAAAPAGDPAPAVRTVPATAVSTPPAPAAALSGPVATAPANATGKTKSH